MSQDEVWVAHHGSLYLSRGLEIKRGLTMDGLEGACKCLGGKPFVEMISAACGESSDLTDYMAEAEDDLSGCFSSIRTVSALSDLSYQEKNTVNKAIVRALKDKVDSTEAVALASPVEKKFAVLAEMLDLEPAEQKLAKMLFMTDTVDCLRNFLDNDLNAFKMLNREILAHILQVSKSELLGSLEGQLSKLDFIDVERNELIRLNDSFYSLLEYPDCPSNISCCAQVMKPELKERDLLVDPNSIELIKELLTCNSATPTHILFYGEAGTGKTQLARYLAQSIGGKVLEVIPGERLYDHRNNLLVTHNLMRKDQGHFLIIDEADKLLETWSPLFNFFGRCDAEKKGWLDYFLEKPGPSAIWIVNDASKMPESVIRRFTFSLPFHKLGAKARESIWVRKQADLGSNLLTEESMAKLASEFEVSPGIISQALSKSLEVGPESESQLNMYLYKQLNAHLELSNRKSRIINVTPNYRPQALVTNPPINDILTRLTSWCDRNRDVCVEERTGLKMLFYGVPGTGKTELAKYLARQLDVEFKHTRVSEILSPFLGQSEINLAYIFETMSKSMSLIVIDEIESFLYKRDIARRPHELSLVNEFLVCLERFNGIFIGSTNRPGDLDPAAIRRFQLKVEFRPLAQSGRVELFESFLVPISGESLTEGQMKNLSQLGQLVPADFSTVADLMNFSLPGSVDNLSLLEALENEAKSRLGVEMSIDSDQAPSVAGPNPRAN
jgi:DNA polymerase III delta prime subunit